MMNTNKADVAPAQAGGWKVTEELDSIQCPICKGYNRLSVSSNKTHVYCAECGDRITEAYLSTQGFDLRIALERESCVAPAQSGQHTLCQDPQNKSSEGHSAVMSSAIGKRSGQRNEPSTALTKQQNSDAKQSSASPHKQRPEPNYGTPSGVEKSTSQSSAPDVATNQCCMDTIATIQDLLTLNGSAQCATVKLTESTKALIAAAPELLQALKDIMAPLDNDEVNSAWQYQHARAAIAKAEGRKL